MTDNEKAATFIGWTDEWCTCCDELDTAKHAELKAKGHKRAAPDMTQPDNYIQALRAIPAPLTWVLHRDADGYHIVVREYGIRRATANHADLAITAVALLATLYDAEHPQ